MFACGDDASKNLNNKTHPLTERCDPSPDYNDCIHVTDEKLHVATDKYAPWRMNRKGNYGSEHVEFESAALNGGLLPMEQMQGHYKNEDEFISRLSQILGVEVSRPRDGGTFGQIVQTGNTIKYSGNPESSQFGDMSFGELVCDAMTDENGDLWVAGERKDIECSRNHRVNYESNTGDGSVATSANTTENALNLDDGHEEVDFDAFKLNLYIYEALGSEFDNYKRDGKSSRWVYNPCWGWAPCWSKEFITTSMWLSNTYYHNDHQVPDPGYILFSNNTSRMHVDALKLKEWWVGAGVCVDDYGNAKPCSGADTGEVNTVCAEGQAGGLVGNVGTNSSCPSGQW